MKDQRAFKLCGEHGGITRAAALLLVLICVMLVLISIPLLKVYRYEAERSACEQAMKSAGDGLIIEYLANWDSGTVEDAMKAIDEIMPERPNICPSGGTVYLIRGSNGIFRPICGLHNSDTKLRTRLNANRALELLGEAHRAAKRAAGSEPKSVNIELNGKKLTCVRVQEEPNLFRGTKTTSGYEDVVAFYGLAGEGTFHTDAVKQGEICYFIYADEDHCANWHARSGWDGEAYH